MDRKSFLRKIGIVSGAATLFGIANTAPIHAAVLDNTKNKSV